MTGKTAGLFRSEQLERFLKNLQLAVIYAA